MPLLLTILLLMIISRLLPLQAVLVGKLRMRIITLLKLRAIISEHNFGHGKKHLSSLLPSLNILAFLFHTLLELFDDKYQLLRRHLPSRKTFFDDLRALTRYIDFDSWEHLLSFMLNGLELHFTPNSS